VRAKRAALAWWCVTVAAAGAARADESAGRELPTGGGHEVVAAAPDTLVRGPRLASVTIDVWVSFGRADATSAAIAVRRALAHASNADVREVLHLSTSGPPGADLAAEAVLAAATEGRGWALCDRLLDDRQLPFTPADLVRAAREAGADGDRVADALESRRYRAITERLERDPRAGRPPGTLLVNGRPATQPYDDANLWAAIDAGRRRARRLLDEGVPIERLAERLAEPDAPAAEPAQKRRPPVRRVRCDVTGSPARGPSLAPVTIVVFATVTCSTCAVLARDLKRLRDAHPGRIREVWKHYSARLSSPSQAAAEIGAGAASQGRFFELLDAALAWRMRSTRPWAHDLDFIRDPNATELLARDAHLDLDRLRREHGDGTLRAILDRDRREADRVGITSEPGVVVNGVVLSGWYGSDELTRVVEDELARGLLERLGTP
jgi:protein-disulfide isomerase